MGLLTNKTADNLTSTKQPRDRFIIGTSGCYFESAAYLTGKMTAVKVKDLLVNPVTQVMGTEGKSLKVMFTTPTGEVKFTGFITAGDASIELDEEDVPTVMKHVADEEVTKAIAAEELVDLF